MKAVKILIFIFVTAAILEGGLRLQQAAGPVYDLEFSHVAFGGMDETLNHINLPGKLHVSFDEIKEMRGKEIDYYSDDNRIKYNPKRQREEGKDVYKIFFMGDSFMDGYEDEYTIPEQVRIYLKEKDFKDRPLEVYNAGTASYSPAIFIPQAKLLLPKIKPDFVVVDVDQTDLADDAFRYQHLIVRNAQGEIEAVRPTPVGYAYRRGYIKIRSNPSYLLRFFLSLHLRFVTLPKMLREYRVKYSHEENPTKIAFERSPERLAEFENVREIFKQNLAELIRVLERFVPKQNILFLFHPHLGHLVPDAEGRLINHWVSESLKEVTGQYGVAFYDATEDIRRSNGAEPQKIYFVGDMHFNYEGLKVYARDVALKIEERLKSIHVI